MHKSILGLLLVQLGILAFSDGDEVVRRTFSLNEGWQSIASDSISDYHGFEQPGYPTLSWTSVDVPHNWDRYEGYRRLQHGNRHGYAWYRKSFEFGGLSERKKYFLFFEGVGSYATVYLNGEEVGRHAGGRTSFTLEVTNQLNLAGTNLLAVRTDHPPFIEDLPWVCGGCSSEYGFSEGSQPMGIFRPVHLVETNPTRIEPFGIHIWNDTTVSKQSASLNIHTEIKNYADIPQTIDVVHEVVDPSGNVKTVIQSSSTLGALQTKKVAMKTPEFGDIELWSPASPNLYGIITSIYQGDVLVDRQETDYGIRWIKWEPTLEGNKRLLLNGEPFFINGTCEYEHNMGNSHAFSDEMVSARVSQMRAAGFNAFRDAHQPHNFGYHHAWDSLGMLWWTQMAAHIWFDTPEFQDNFKSLMRDWVKERRNSPSVILWGLENESTLPEWFAKECTAIIRELDPTSPTQRLVTTCNGGTGTDWDVPQNWTGTYGGNPNLYHEDLKRQILVGEYGAWRTADQHTEGPFDKNGTLSEDRMTLLMEKKVRLADSVKDQTGGHFQWIFTSHENPGRNQSGEGLRELDRVGPVNYKGLLTSWGEPLDVFYMYRSNFISPEEDPMVYIVSHTWPYRWTTPGVKDSIAIYSNCHEVELFNGSISLGRQANPGIGRHFQWDGVPIHTNLLRAVGYVNGQQVTEDMVQLIHLPNDGYLSKRRTGEVALADKASRKYLYRVNCGGGHYRDSNGNKWMADVSRTSEQRWGSSSWTDEFDDMPPYYASQRRTFDPILNTANEELFQTFRFGMDKLKYHFPVEAGSYEVSLYFIEPWYGTGGAQDCTSWRVFDVSVNGQTVIDDLDIWQEVGHDRVVIKTLEVEVEKGDLVISFPEVKSGQAVISAISISTLNEQLKPAPPSPSVLQHAKVQSWLDWGAEIYTDSRGRAHLLTPELFGAEWIKLEMDDDMVDFSLSREADLFVGVLAGVEVPDWLNAFDDTKEVFSIVQGKELKYRIFKKRFPTGKRFSWREGEFAKKYIVMAQPSAKMEPPYDLKPKKPYDEDVAILESKGLLIEQKFGFGCVTFTADSEQKVSWPIHTGVADYHAIHFKYSNETGGDLEAVFNLIAADGTLMQSSPIAFVESREGKYQQEAIYTESMINAGAYLVQITGQNLKGLSIRGIRVQ